MAQSPTPEHPPIPRFVVPRWHTNDVYRNFPVFRSPEDGPIVQITDDLWHAATLEDWMQGDGERLALKHFEEAALDPATYPEYSDRPNEYDLRKKMASTAYNLVLDRVLWSALEIGWALQKENPEAYQANPYGHYSSWSRDPARKGQFLVGTQRAYDIYQGLKHHADPRKQKHKYLRTFDALFEAEPPDDEPTGLEEPDEEFS